MVLAVCALLASCAAPNPALNQGQFLSEAPPAGRDYDFRRWLEARPTLPPKLVILSFSGGGVRAATLARGVLETLSREGFEDHVALISSTSGGSVTAAVFASQGAPGLAAMEAKFLRHDNMKELVPRLLPLVFLPDVNRSTTFADYLEGRLLEHGPKVYGELIDRWGHAPFVILNSTDMSAGQTFEFTQESFSRLCSDLSRFRISYAIAASAAFPFLMNPLPLRNNWDQGACSTFMADQGAEALRKANENKYLDPDGLARARYVHSLQFTYDQGAAERPDREIKFVHLLDGGLSDNLAARALLRALDANYKLLKTKGVRRILLVQVNARSSQPNAYDVSPDIPSLVDVFWSVTMNPIDIATELSSYASRQYLVQLVRSEAEKEPEDRIWVYPVAVDFNLLDKREERVRAQRIGTSWSLADPANVPFLKDVAGRLVTENPCYINFKAAPGRPPGPPSQAEDCQFLDLSQGIQAMGPPGEIVAAAPPGAPAPAPAAAPVPAPAAPPAPPPAATKVTYAADAFFDFDRSDLKPEGKAKLDDLIGKIRDVALEVIIAVGHTDSVGTDAYNQALSVRRAEAVKAYLVARGIEENRVYTEGKGEKQPVADNKTAEGRAKNRRVEIEVVGTRANR